MINLFFLYRTHVNLNTKESLSDKQKFCFIPRNSRKILVHISATKHSKDRDRFIKFLVDEGYLENTTPNSPRQKYIVKEVKQ